MHLEEKLREEKRNQGKIEYYTIINFNFTKGKKSGFCSSTLVSYTTYLNHSARCPKLRELTPSYLIVDDLWTLTSQLF